MKVEAYLFVESQFIYAYVAQQVAHSLGKAEVTSSNLVVSSIFFNRDKKIQQI